MEYQSNVQLDLVCSIPFLFPHQKQPIYFFLLTEEGIGLQFLSYTAQEAKVIKVPPLYRY